MSAPRQPDTAQAEAPLCASCGAETPALEAIIYHGVVYHPACVAPTLRRTPAAPRVEPELTGEAGERR